MNRLGLAGAVAVWVLVWAGSVRAADPQPEPSNQDNTPPPGFVALFDGKDLNGWKGLVESPPKRAKLSPDQLAAKQKVADDTMRKHWSAKDGVLEFDGKGQNLCSAKDYGDFELWVDWKIDKGADSGIYLRGTPQVQIWDPDNAGEKKNGADKGSGGLWNNKKHPNSPLVRADRPIGEWNRFYIKMVGEKVTVYLNDKLVVDQVPLENYWEKDKPIYPTGAIELQNHNHKLWFKNIYVKELSK